MKYLKMDPFQKHLDEALPDHPSPVYFVCIADADERRFVAERIVKSLGLPTQWCDGETFSRELETPSLFAEKRVLICDSYEGKQLHLSDDLILVLTSKSPTALTKKLEKEGVTLDLSGEKPWDRKPRLQRWLLEIAHAGGKKLDPAAAAYLLEFSPEAFAPLVSEVEKALVYTGDEKEVTLQAVKTIATLDPKQNGWQLSEAAVWGGPALLDDTDLYSLVGQLRYQLALGLQVAEGKPAKGSPKKIDKIRAKGLQASFYREGFQDLFELEMKLRSNISNQALLFDHFRAKLAARRDG
ncbi:DNA polymerase III subunit delta [Candidatus Neptunochlamydia vexilliferae]|uniref:DNA polymerase III delta N-terminal domain-containing protein n=1 Tax=Candidatus Neptunichlamydia vexilliferae TaxID=1651774 RepID=A0ABS0B136_9BACT|nr:hypothetical protein [Candidatus Neptunochlamydia vexilliferae]MBF5060113.1 hypothetical protein [Candidatus Neptunochlamydia vexilliferae]